MLNNPFTSDIFTTIWSKYFNEAKAPIEFGTFSGVKFYKSGKFSIYINTGKNISNGMSYSIDNHVKDYKSKVFLIHDVPTYFDLKQDLPKGLELKKVKQYSGLLTTLDAYESLDDILSKKFNAKRRAEFRKFKKRLETCFTINYDTLFGEISKEDYDTVMGKFYSLLTARYDGKQTMNYNLTEHKWAYYKALIYPMILEKKASIFVIKNEEEPISIGVNFHSEDTMFYMMPAFDVNFAKYNLGHVSVMTMLQWGIEQGFKRFDFSKGDAVYKRKWSDIEYNFEHHILFDSKSIISLIKGKTLVSYFNFKQYLRDKNINAKLKDLAYKLKGKPKQQGTSSQLEYTETNDLVVSDTMVLEETNKAPDIIKKATYDFLYKYSEHLNSIKLYRDADAKVYYIFGNKKQLQLKLIS